MTMKKSDKFLTQEEVDRALDIKPEDLEDLSDVELEEEIDWGPPQGKEEW